jgi:predicted DsbA family dithiol-disulfide isomerase
MAFANPHITAVAVEATEFPDLARQYQISGVPKTIVNDAIEILGALPEDAFVAQALSALSLAASSQPENQPK